jgi:hypothetical protein
MSSESAVKLVCNGYQRKIQSTILSVYLIYAEPVDQEERERERSPWGSRAKTMKACMTRAIITKKKNKRQDEKDERSWQELWGRDSSSWRSAWNFVNSITQSERKAYVRNFFLGWPVLIVGKRETFRNNTTSLPKDIECVVASCYCKIGSPLTSRQETWHRVLLPTTLLTLGKRKLYNVLLSVS